ncbi:hypothetical protein [Frisingicoccus sp.]|uniref:hypothetical protein n=1 Tax=Frisingicoccus sp. TaxID=1918627 RepID=UPI00262B7CE2|nr:hypothetical protein [Frisingicoccus sp.]MDD6233164.1 hypothetical protein [Frisingicoccus sp.]MDY4835209.1 hypothetical protein [Frisingicoccus sp.]MDY4921897.1 hypothetical protein [Frisingicoccus sp.]
MSGVMTGDIICKAVFEIIVAAVLIKEWMRLFGGAKVSSEAYIYDLQPLKRQIINVIVCSVVFLAWFYGNMMIKSGGISVVDAAFGCVLMGELIGVIILGSLKKEQDGSEEGFGETQEAAESWEDMKEFRRGASNVSDKEAFDEVIPVSEEGDELSDREDREEIEESINIEEGVQEEVPDLPEKSRKIRRLTDISEFEKIEKEMEEEPEKEDKAAETEEQKHEENMNETEFEEISDWSEE